MISLLVMICFIAHILGDFYLQTDKMATSKLTAWKGLLFHGLIYFVPFLLAFVMFEYSTIMILILLLIGTSHLFVDTLKFVYYKVIDASDRDKHVQTRAYLYLLDQGLHVIAIIVICYLFQSYEFNINNWVISLLQVLPVPIFELLKWLLLLLLLNRPVNITIHQLFSFYKPKEKEKRKEDSVIMKIIAASTGTTKQFDESEEEADKKDSDKRAGALIGFLERILIVIFLSVSQYAAIGFVLTAKSIVRYDRIAKDQEFSEYYLIGTLFSFIAALVSYYLIF